MNIHSSTNAFLKLQDRLARFIDEFNTLFKKEILKYAFDPFYFSNGGYRFFQIPQFHFYHGSCPPIFNFEK